MRPFLATSLPFVSLALLAWLTFEATKSKLFKPYVSDAYSRWGTNPMSYVIVFVLGGSLFCFYWWGISKVFAHFGSPMQTVTASSSKLQTNAISRGSGDLLNGQTVGRKLADSEIYELAAQFKRLKTSEMFYIKVDPSADDGSLLANDIGKALRNAGIPYSIQPTTIIGHPDKGVLVGTIGETSDSLRDQVANALKDKIPEVQISLRGQHPAFTPMFREARGIGIIIGHR
jgi:hypothetical protein